MPSDKITQSSRNKQEPDHKGEIITPLKVRRQSDPSPPRRSSRISLLILLIVLAALAAGGFILIRYIAEHPLELTDNTMPAIAPPDQQQVSEFRQPVDPARGTDEKENAERQLAQFVKLKQEIEEKGVAQWGGEEYEEMVNLSKEADALLMDDAFPAAAEKYARAGRKAASLTDKADAVFQSLIEEGQKALDDGDSITAREKFQTALMIWPSDQRVRRKLKRAENLDSVNRLIESGRNHESNNRLAFAHADYEKALRLDPQSRDAQKALKRVNERIVDEQFQKYMSDGLTAYHSGNYQKARTMLLKAQSFRPDSREVQNALVQVDEAIRLDNIEKLRKKGMEAEKAEKWEQALKSYLAVLEIDPHVSFAAEGRERSLEQIRIDKRITFFLQKPDALESDQQLQNAVLLIEEAGRLRPGRPRLSGQLNELKTLVDVARTPVKVIIESDNLTDIAVYKVGKLGRFNTRELSLRPRTYTVVGSRDGYKDVRQKLIVKPDQKEVRITIICRDQV
jgi:tetratricopeptide (TPR) repeat protein